MTRSILFAAVFAAVSLPAAGALSQGTETQGQPSRGRDTQGQPGQGQSGQGRTGQGQTGQGQTGQQGVQADTKGTKLDKQDRDFIDDAAKGGLYEVRAGQLAQQKAQADDVKQFGKRMVDDHTAINGRLQQLAQQKGLNLPQQLDRKHQDKIDNLSKKTGADFDKAYLDQMVDDHKKDVDDFDKAAKDAKDPDVKSFAASTLPMLREHLQQVQSVKERLKT
jgi:putative membrane protein